MFTIIAAIGRSNELGKDGDLIWHLPSDMKFFRETTSGHTIIMGRKTFESLPKGALPNRRNIVLSRSTKNFEGCECFGSLKEALAHCQPDEDVYVIGGASVYREAMKRANRLCLTEVHDTPAEADTFFPPYGEWREVWREEHAADERHAHAFAFVDYEPEEG